MVSLFSRRMFVLSPARIPMLFARANPRFTPASITRTPGRRRAVSALPSVDPLSTTMISVAAAGGEA